MLPLAVLALAAPAVAADFQTGGYKGKTKQKKTIRFKADMAAGEIKGLKFGERGKCNNGDKSKGTQGPLSTDVDDSGKFHIDATSPSGSTRLVLNGTISGSKAHGKFTVKSRFDSSGAPNPNGSVKCSTGKVKWSAKLNTSG